MFSEAGYDLNIQSICVANWHSINLMNANPTLNFILDRTIVDDFALMHLYFKKELNLDVIQEHINQINIQSKNDYLYDELIIIKNSNDHEFIKNSILSDSQRKNSKSLEAHLSNAKAFYELVEYFLLNLSGIAKKVTYKEFAELTPDYFL